MKFSKFIQPLKLPKRDSGDFAGKKVVLAGYGDLNNHGKREYRSRWANFTVISDKECKKYEEIFIETLTERNICAIGELSVESGCEGENFSSSNPQFSLIKICF